MAFAFLRISRREIPTGERATGAIYKYTKSVYHIIMKESRRKTTFPEKFGRRSARVPEDRKNKKKTAPLGKERDDFFKICKE